MPPRWLAASVRHRHAYTAADKVYLQTLPITHLPQVANGPGNVHLSECWRGLPESRTSATAVQQQLHTDHASNPQHALKVAVRTGARLRLATSGVTRVSAENVETAESSILLHPKFW